MRARPQLTDGSSRQVQSAIDIEDDAGDEAVADEKRDGLGDFVDGCRAEASGAERLAAWNIPAGLSAHHGLSMTPGETALTRRGASSLARVLARLSSAPSTPAKPEVPGPALREDAAVTKRATPDPPSPIWGKADCAACQCTQNLPSKPRRRARASSSAKGPAPLPAEAARIKWSIGAARLKKASSAIRSEASNASPAPDGPSDAGRRRLLPVASDDRHAGAPGDEQLRRRQSDPGRAADDDDMRPDSAHGDFASWDRGT